MTEKLAESSDSVLATLRSMRRGMRILTFVVGLLALGLFLDMAAVFGNLVEYHAGEALLRGAVAVAAGVVGFAFGFGFGWFARRR